MRLPCSWPWLLHGLRRATGVRLDEDLRAIDIEPVPSDERVAIGGKSGLDCEHGREVLGDEMVATALQGMLDGQMGQDDRISVGVERRMAEARDEVGLDVGGLDALAFTKLDLEVRCLGVGFDRVDEVAVGPAIDLVELHDRKAAKELLVELEKRLQGFDAGQDDCDAVVVHRVFHRVGHLLELFVGHVMNDVLDFVEMHDELPRCSAGARRPFPRGDGRAVRARPHSQWRAQDCAGELHGGAGARHGDAN